MVEIGHEETTDVCVEETEITNVQEREVVRTRSGRKINLPYRFRE